MAHTNKMRNYIIEKKFLLPTYLILLPNNKCIPKLQQYLPIPSHPSPRKKEIQIPKECVLSRSLFPTYLIPRSAVAADRRVYTLLYHEGAPGIHATAAENARWSVESDVNSLHSMLSWQALTPAANVRCQSSPLASSQVGWP